MLQLNTVLSCIFLLLGNYLSTSQIDRVDSSNDVVHNVTIFHPGMKESKECQLVERRESTGRTSDFYMEVESVICLDGLCKVVQVRLIWDLFGSYLNYELGKGVALEKKDGAPFAAADYEKLQQILQDKRSIFHSYELGQIVDLTKGNAGIDGITGATILTDESTTVKGAAWTCYTLWHWANGEVKDLIFDLTGSRLTNPELLDLLKQDTLSVRLALSQFKLRSMYDEATIGAVTKAIQGWDAIAAKQGVRYLKEVPSAISFPTFRTLFPKVGRQQRVLFLKTVLDDTKYAPAEILNELPHYISSLDSFQELNLILNYLESRMVQDAKLNEQLLMLLAGEDFIVARRVYWFLNDQDLSPVGMKKLKEFGDEHAGRL